MTPSNRIKTIKSNAAELLASLNADTLSLPMTWVAEQVEYTKIKKYFRGLTVGGLLQQVCRMGGNIPKAYCEAANAIFDLFPTTQNTGENVVSLIPVKPTAAPTIPILGGGNAPLFERIVNTIEGIIEAMKNCGSEGAYRQAVIIEDYCFNTASYSDTAKEHGYTRQNIELAVKKFNKLFLEGKSWGGLEGLYKIDLQLIADIHKTVDSLHSRVVGALKTVIGSIDSNPLAYILRMLDFDKISIGGVDYIIEKGKQQRFTQIADTARRRLAKSVEAIALDSLSEGLSVNEASFLMRYLSFTSGVKFIEGSDNVIMTGKGLEEAVRQARIIYEADGWISKEEIAARYEAEYAEPMGAFSSYRLHELGCTNHNKLGYWAYGTEKIGKVKDVILAIMTAEKPVATYATLHKAIREKGLLYPERTIRACITDLACPENKNHDLFCLKGYTHLFPSLSWRSYKKQPA